jgi:SEFIR domain
LEEELYEEAIAMVLADEVVAPRLKRHAAQQRQALSEHLRTMRPFLLARGAPELVRLTGAALEAAENHASAREAEALKALSERWRDVVAAVDRALDREEEQRTEVAILRANRAADAGSAAAQAPRRRRLLRWFDRDQSFEAAYQVARAEEELQHCKRGVADAVTNRMRLHREIAAFLDTVARSAARRAGPGASPRAPGPALADARAAARPVIVAQLIAVAEPWLDEREETDEPDNAQDAEVSTSHAAGDESPPMEASSLTPRVSPTQSPSPTLESPSAFVSWAHGHGSWDATRQAEWASVVTRFANALRHVGIDADLDRFHEHAPDINWQTYGSRAIHDNDYVLIAVSRGYKERWEGRNPPTEGAGAAREANVLKSLFDRDQATFWRKVKLVILPGASPDDIPDELGGMRQFVIQSLEQQQLEDLVRTLTGQPRYAKSPIGQLAALPPVEP